MLCNGVFCKKKKICLSWLYHSLHYLTPSHSPISLDPITQHILFQFPLPPTHLIFSSLSLTTFSHHSLPHIVTPPTPSHLTHTTSYNSPNYLNTSHSTLSLAPFPTPSPTLSSNNLAHFTHHQIIAPFSSFFCSTISLTHLTHPSVPTLTRLSHLQHSLHSHVSFLSLFLFTHFSLTVSIDPTRPMIYPFHLILSTQSRHSLPLSLIPSSTPTLSKFYSPTHSPLSLTTWSPHSLAPSHFPLSPFTYSTTLAVITNTTRLPIFTSLTRSSYHALTTNPPPFPPSHYPTITLNLFFICFVQFTYPTLSPYFVSISH